MYKIDDEFRPPGRVFMKATRENPPGSNPVPVPIRKSSLKKAVATSSTSSTSTSKGPAITTSLDDRHIQFKHEVKHEKTIEALITEYPPGDHYRSAASIGDELPNRLVSSSQHHSSSSHKYDSSSVPHHTGDVAREVIHYTSSNKGGSGSSNFDVPDGVSSLQAVTRNKRTSTEVLGSSFESKKLSQRATDGNRRITTHIVRKMTTLSRAEENAQSKNLVHTAHNKTTEYGYMASRAIEPPRAKVLYMSSKCVFYVLRTRTLTMPIMHSTSTSHQ